MDIIRTQNKRLYHGHKFENKELRWDYTFMTEKNAMEQQSLAIETNV